MPQFKGIKIFEFLPKILMVKKGRTRLWSSSTFENLAYGCIRFLDPNSIYLEHPRPTCLSLRKSKILNFYQKFSRSKKGVDVYKKINI